MIVVLFCVTVLSAVTGTVFFNVQARRGVVHQSTAWQESLASAEAGVQQAMAQLDQGLASGEETLPTMPVRYVLNLPHVGISSNTAQVDYSLVPEKITRRGFTRTYYHILSNGTVRLGGPRGLGADIRDVNLRKLDLSSAVQTGATRKIHAMVRPVYNTDGALKTNNRINMNNHNIFVDSFNSLSNAADEEGLRHHNGGPSPTMGGFNVADGIYRAHVATNSAALNPGAAFIYGDALSNGGTIGSPNNVYGEIRDDFNERIADQKPPTWITSAGVTNLGTVNNSTSIVGGAVGAPARYLVTSFRLSGNKTVSFDNPAGSTASEIEIYVSGDLSTKGGGSGDGQFVVAQGANVKIFVVGDVTLGGNGMTNQNGNAANLSLFGVNTNADNSVVTTTQTWTFSGTSRFFGTVYAPGAHVVLNGGGSTDHENGGTYVGSIVANSAELKGRVHIRYDEALARSGRITRFELMSWFEDTKKEGQFSF